MSVYIDRSRDTLQFAHCTLGDLPPWRRNAGSKRAGGIHSTKDPWRRSKMMSTDDIPRRRGLFEHLNDMCWVRSRRQHSHVGSCGNL